MKAQTYPDLFENVRETDNASDANPESLRISVDSKAEVNIGEFILPAISQQIQSD